LVVGEEPWSLWFHGKKIINDISTVIYDIVHTPSVKNYWMRKDNISKEVIESIYRDSVGDAMKEVPRKCRVFISKHVCGMCGVGKFMHQWKLRQDSSCPRCGEHEDSCHVLTCNGKGADNVWEKSNLCSGTQKWYPA
jgi:hypothetical protein